MEPKESVGIFRAVICQEPTASQPAAWQRAPPYQEPCCWRARESEMLFPEPLHPQ